MFDPVSKPAHYNQWPIEVIEITGHLDFSLGNSCKYILRHSFKGNPRQDIEKALWYLNYRIEQFGGAAPPFSRPAHGNAYRLVLHISREDKEYNWDLLHAILDMADGKLINARSRLQAYLDSLPN